MSTEHGSAINYINEEFETEAVTVGQIDELLADGWRHFGTHFFRYNLAVYENEIRRVIPLRVRLAAFRLSKSQRRILRKNADAETEIRPIEITDDTHDLFERHKRRFKTGVPASIYDFLSRDPANQPVTGLEVSVKRNDQLLAVSFFDLGETSISSIYGIFDPDETARGLGIFTMLKEIEFAQTNGKSYFYHGYSYEAASYYDYKKRFSGLEQYDWSGNWTSRVIKTCR